MGVGRAFPNRRQLWSTNQTTLVEAKIPSGTPGNVVRTVTENSRTLKFTSHGFETVLTISARDHRSFASCAVRWMAMYRSK